jgi:hypothetical protein
LLPAAALGRPPVTFTFCFNPIAQGHSVQKSFGVGQTRLSLRHRNNDICVDWMSLSVCALYLKDGPTSTQRPTASRRLLPACAAGH